MQTLFLAVIIALVIFAFIGLVELTTWVVEHPKHGPKAAFVLTVLGLLAFIYLTYRGDLCH
jgi:hypothetical protein